MTAYEAAIGLEVHIELNTRTKIFCGCSTAFGGEPNTHCCPVCSGLPGALPRLNRAVVEKAVLAGLALGCDIRRHNVFDRKNYFYPDLPKAYQISQLYLPICEGGGLLLSSGRFVRIREIHMEEDAGKLVHDPWTESTLCDYNRCGVPLIEIVTQPDLKCADEVTEFLQTLKTRLEFAGVTDGKMQEGSLRADLNISLRPVGSSTLGTRTEMKNMNSFKAIHKAVEVETQRQAEILNGGGRVLQETRRWDGNKDASFAMRSKENAQDYRYFPEPDLPPVDIDDTWMQELKDALPEMPDVKRERYLSELRLPERDVNILCQSAPLCRLLERCVDLGVQPRSAANWLLSEVLKLLNERGLEPADLALPAESLCRVIQLVEGGKIGRADGRNALQAAFDGQTNVDEYVARNGLLREEAGEADLEAAVRQVLAENADAVASFRAGKQKSFGFLTGQCLKALKGRADPKRVSELLRRMLEQ